MKSPKWLENAVFYEIYPQSFFDSNADGIGDLNGTSKKLDYIKNTGFNALWINPIYESTFFDAGYDVSDYKKVAARYGGNSAFLRLLKKCKEKGIRVLLDLVPGHTALNHKWFLESQKATENEYSSRYIWNKNVWDCDSDFNWIRGFSERNGGAMINFFSIQPKLNYGFETILHPEYEERVEGKGPQGTIKAMIDIIRYYLDLGVDGFRVDMAGWLVARDPKGEGTKRVWKQIFGEIKKDYPESAFVSEWAEPTKSLEAGFDMDFLLQDMHFDTFGLLTRYEKPFFRYKEKEYTAPKFFEIVSPLLEFAQSHDRYLALLSGNHDTERLASWLSQEEALLYYAFMLTFPCVPFFYYGDEIGMRQVKNIKSVEGGYQRTGARSPMQWDNSLPNAGFSLTKGKCYIPLDKFRKGISVKEESKYDNSLYNCFRYLLNIKKEHVALDNNASFKLIDNGEDGILIYERSKDDETLRIYLNAHEKAKEFTIPANSSFVASIGNNKLKNNQLLIAKQGVAIIKL